MSLPEHEPLPPLNALRAFEAAARHLSFTRAAEELHVTQAAVSHQIRVLEDHLGVRLFRRHARRLLLTDAGQILAPELRSALERIRDTCRRVRSTRVGGRLAVTVTPYFSAKWLAPRVGDFWDHHPEIELRLHHAVTPPDFARGDAEAAVRWGVGPWPNLHCDFLFRAEPTPTFAPSLLEGPNAIRSPSDLHHELIVYDNDDNLEGWQRWLQIAGVKDVDARKGMLIDDVHVMVQAAVDGRAVAMVTRMMVADHIADGRLVQPFNLEVSGFSYYLVFPPGDNEGPNLAAFRSWLLTQAEDYRRSNPAAARACGEGGE